MFDLLLTFYDAKSILHLRGKLMRNIGRPREKKYVYLLKMDEQVKMI